LFLGLAVVCDEWFVPSLEKISETLNLSADVAGATFLAAGSSAPEFFTSLADTFSTSNSVGVGTIVGSAMFNILVIVAMAAASTSETLNIDWRPVTRDCTFYGVSIATLIIFFQDGKIYWYEGLIMTVVYFLYILFMVFNAKIFKKCEKAKIEPDPEYAPGRRKSVSHHKGMFQGKVREVQLVDGTEGVLDEEAAVVKTEDGQEIAVSEKPTDSTDVEAPAAVAEEVVKPAEGESEKKDDDDEDDPDNYWSRFEW
jgi:Ca2+/Na+ antiporter